MKKVTLAVPCYNAERFLERTMQGIMQQSYPIKEVLIIDDGSKDGTAKIAAQYDVKLIKHSSNKGLAAARNTAIRACRTEFIAFLDADCAAEPKWLGILMGELTEQDIAAVGGRLMEQNTSTTPDLWRVVHMSQHHGASKSARIGCLAGSNVVFRVSAIKKAGLFDVRYRTNYEDCDMSNRLRALGFFLVYQPHAVAWHMRTDTAASVLETYWRWCYSYKRGIDSSSKFIRTALSSFYLGPKLFFEDLAHLRLGLCVLDLILPFHHLGITCKNYVIAYQNKKASMRVP